ncbi:hypothetical protein Lser_V15G11106 [Lactuca serriola]
MSSRDDEINKCEVGGSMIGSCRLLLLQKPSGVIGADSTYTSTSVDVKKGSRKVTWQSEESFRTVMYLSCWGLN